ncbi:MAG: hypothetical protein ACRDHE_01430, partial [Ktedonobacterales bacterium]
MPHLRERGLCGRSTRRAFAPWSRRRRHEPNAPEPRPPAECEPLFENPFAVDDLAIFDDDALRELLAAALRQFDARTLAHAMVEADPALVERARLALPLAEQVRFSAALGDG